MKQLQNAAVLSLAAILAAAAPSAALAGSPEFAYTARNGQR